MDYSHSDHARSAAEIFTPEPHVIASLLGILAPLAMRNAHLMLDNLLLDEMVKERCPCCCSSQLDLAGLEKERREVEEGLFPLVCLLQCMETLQTVKHARLLCTCSRQHIAHGDRQYLSRQCSWSFVQSINDQLQLTNLPHPPPALSCGARVVHFVLVIRTGFPSKRRACSFLCPTAWMLWCDRLTVVECLYRCGS